MLGATVRGLFGANYYFDYLLVVTVGYLVQKKTLLLLEKNFNYFSLLE